MVGWENLWAAWKRAAQDKRSRSTTCRFEFHLADELLQLQRELVEGRYRPGPYVHFTLNEGKRRLISAAPFRDRVVHHALCAVIEPRFESIFIPDSYANRVGKGTHKAIDRFQQLARRYRYVLRMDVVKHFPSIDHQILFEILDGRLRDPRIAELIRRILASGADLPEAQADACLFPGDDLLDLCRPKGLPIGNLTSQFWSNCYLHPFDQFVKRELGCQGYLRYVDDFALFSDSKAELWAWRHAVIERLARLRLRVHENAAQVAPVVSGIPWLGFVVYPTHRLLKARKAVHATRHLTARYGELLEGRIRLATFRASVQAWINHARHGDTWGLRAKVLYNFVLPLGQG